MDLGLAGEVEEAPPLDEIVEGDYASRDRVQEGQMNGV